MCCSILEMLHKAVRVLRWDNFGWGASYYVLVIPIISVVALTGYYLPIVQNIHCHLITLDWIGD